MELPKKLLQAVPKALKATADSAPVAAANTVAKKAFKALTDRFLIMHDHEPYWDSKPESSTRPGEV